MDNGSDPNSITFIDLALAVAWDVTEQVGALPAGWVLDSIVCSGGSDITIVESVGNVKIRLSAGEDVTCTFNNGVVTPVTLAAFDATVQADGSVLLAWETAAEIDNAGFNVYRSHSDIFVEADAVQVNASLIPAQASLGQGAAYALVDANASPGLWYYYLQDVDTNGTTAIHGPVSADTSAPTSVSMSDLTGSTSATMGMLVVLISALGVIAFVSYQRQRPKSRPGDPLE